MLKLEDMRKLLEESLPAKRFDHSVLVYETALKLAKRWGGPKEKVAVAALLHDCGREVPTRESLAKAEELGLPVDYVERNQPILLHAKLGVYYARQKYGVTDPEILDAIGQHTTGAPQMTQTSMIVYLADLLEPTRDFPGIETLRELAKQDLERALFKAYSNTMTYLLEYGLLIHPSCVAAYNELAARYKKEAMNAKLTAAGGKTKKEEKA
jgi:predicted HD superfamily hydrolase involved in NAD metabolism